MKTLLALTVLILLCVLKHSSAKSFAMQMTTKNVECCEISKTVYIPRKRVTHVLMTSGCPREAIIIIIETGRKFCFDPEWKHARMHLEIFKKKTSSST